MPRKCNSFENAKSSLLSSSSSSPLLLAPFSFKILHRRTKSPDCVGYLSESDFETMEMAAWQPGPALPYDKGPALKGQH